MSKILVITPVNHIPNVASGLAAIGQVDFLDDPSARELKSVLHDYDAIFTNPNKSKIFLGPEILKKAKKLKVICTASTGTNHIDLDYANKHGIEVLCLKEERKVINKISSTAEHAFSLMLSSIRNINAAHQSVLAGKWDYCPFVGKQLNCLNIGILGFGRLGKKFAKFANAFTDQITIFDPYKKVRNKNYTQVEDLSQLANDCDVISIHVHVTEETTGMIDSHFLERVKDSVLFVNTSRGEIVDEAAMVGFLKQNPQASLATDVLRDEIRNRDSSPLFKYAKSSDQVLITPHIGGMTIHAQAIAYNHAVELLKLNLGERN